MISWDGQQWRLSRAGSQDTTPLGAKPTARSIAGVFKNTSGVRLLVNLPPSRELIQQFLSMSGSNSVEIVRDPLQALYVLVGAEQDGQIRYSWLRKSALEQAATRPGTQELSGVCSEDSPYPARSDWVPLSSERDTQAAADRLVTLAGRLAKVHAWLKLRTPQGDSADFPYHLALKRVSDGAYAADAPTRESEQYNWCFVRIIRLRVS